ncbi:MAG: NTP transferase domain-containing protein [Sutterella sp.]|nr:NTP transferase domain-containing protein [Sutterella sp.]
MTKPLTRKEFNLLTTLASCDESLSQRELARRSGFSLGTANKLLSALTQSDLVADNRITESGLSTLEPFRVKKAVFLAAGFGSRLVPVTLNTPQPLVRVNGKRLIDGLIDAVLALGITDITIVRGYLGEQFDQLLYKYPMIRFLENPIYNESNNISSALVARFGLANAYVLESDLLIKNPSILRKYHYESDFLGIPKARSDDWCFMLKNGFIAEEKFGGLNCYQMVGISYWNAQDGAKLSADLKEAYEQPGGKERYWEQVPLCVFKDKYQVGILPCTQEDIVEIDTFRELKQIDKAYCA